MSNGIAEKPLSFFARVAGVSLLIVAATGIFANLFALGTVIVPDDAAATANNITANDLLFRFGVLGFILMNILDLVIAWALYVLLKRVDKHVALLAIFFRIIFVAISSAALFGFLNILTLLGDDVRLEAIETNQVGHEVVSYIDAVNNASAIALIFFGVHLLLLGYLIFKSAFIPSLLGILLMLAGLGYLIANIGWVLFSDDAGFMGIVTIIIFLLAIIAELAFAIWLLVKGKKIAGSDPA